MSTKKVDGKRKQRLSSRRVNAAASLKHTREEAAFLGASLIVRKNRCWTFYDKRGYRLLQYWPDHAEMLVRGEPEKRTCRSAARAIRQLRQIQQQRAKDAQASRDA